MKKIKIITILGTRPEIIKLSPILPLLDKEFNHILIHTGQHYSFNLDAIFFEELCLKAPDYNLNTGSGTHAEQLGKMIIGIEKVLFEENPDAVIVFADPNTPLAGALAASKINIPVIHIEAGCRCNNKSVPEEINRILVDHCSNILFAPDKVAYSNLIREGIPKEKIHLVGSTAIDSVLRNIKIAEKSDILNLYNLKKDSYILVTVHRAENTDNKTNLKNIVEALNKLSDDITIIFSVHPRTLKALETHNIKLDENIKDIEPPGYLEFLKLMKNALFIITDSGGIQEEAAVLDIPVLILRNETEWTYLTDIGKNKLVGQKSKDIIKEAKDLIDNKEKLEKMKKVKVDFTKNVAEKIVQILKNELKK